MTDAVSQKIGNEPFIEKNSFDLSIIVPCYNDGKSLPLLIREINAALKKTSFRYQIIVIDDGSQHPIEVKVQPEFQEKSEIIMRRHPKNLGKSMAWETGFNYAEGRYIITLDADLQDNPIYIETFIEKLILGSDIVTGVRCGWQNGFRRYIASRCYNTIVNAFFGTSLLDHNCGFKGFRSELVKGIQLAPGQHRLLVAILSSRGALVTECPIQHRPRRWGNSSYGMMRAIEFLFSLYKNRRTFLWTKAIKNISLTSQDCPPNIIQSTKIST